MVQAQEFLEAVCTLQTYFIDLAILNLLLKNRKELTIISLLCRYVAVRTRSC